ncbi:MAG: FAD-binding oxidoreductase [Anaerolineaceae bacterium]|nr:FAD-binding oxidoreductase [Anaerolineaceae bacterium]
MNFQGKQVELSNWSKSARSQCLVYQASDPACLAEALAAVRAQRLSVIPHGAGHSYTDAALNSGGVVIDVTGMRQILSWDAEHGIMRVEPGVSLREMVQCAWPDGWWPVVAPSTPDVTIGGCAAMNVNGRNAWKCGPFGEYILSMDVLLANGEFCTLSPQREPQLFYAFVGSLGLLGIITSITVQLQRISSGYVAIRKRSAACLDEIFNLFAEEASRSNFMEAWLDGFARADQLGRGLLTSSVFDDSGQAPSPFLAASSADRFGKPFVNLAANLLRTGLSPLVHTANRLHYRLDSMSHPALEQHRALVPYTFWPPAAFAGYHAVFTEGVETFHAFVPGHNAQEIFRQVLSYSQQQGCLPVWCVIKQHRRDPFLLSYQVDGFSLELNYQRTHQNAETLKRMLQHSIAAVVEAGGRFYLAKDHFLTAAQYRQSIGDEALDTFLHLKQSYDPDMLLQSDLFRRVFRPALD